MFILSSVLFRCYEWGINVNFSDQTSEEYIPLVKSTFPSLTGRINNSKYSYQVNMVLCNRNSYPGPLHSQRHHHHHEQQPPPGEQREYEHLMSDITDDDVPGP